MDYEDLFNKCDVYRIERGQIPKVCLYKDGELFFSFFSDQKEVEKIRKTFRGKESYIY